MRNILGIAIAGALLAPVAIAPTQAEARRHYDRDYYRDRDRDRDYREWRGRDGRMYCRKSNGTVGLLVGGAGGALVGRAIDTRGDRATGTILGAAAGALIGKSVDSKRTCR
jgi:hypothetical protein